MGTGTMALMSTHSLGVKPDRGTISSQFVYLEGLACFAVSAGSRMYVVFVFERDGERRWAKYEIR